MSKAESIGGYPPDLLAHSNFQVITYAADRLPYKIIDFIIEKVSLNPSSKPTNLPTDGCNI
jgi:hypothetical protein